MPGAVGVYAEGEGLENRVLRLKSHCLQGLTKVLTNGPWLLSLLLPSPHFFIEREFTYCIIHLLYSVQSNDFSYIHRDVQLVLEHFHHPKRKLYTHSPIYLIPFYSFPPLHHILASIPFL